MAFKNEYVPPLDQETSEFLKKARETLLRTGYGKFDRWTVDRERNMVLYHDGSGREVDDTNHDLWSFIDRDDYYVFSTDRLSKSEISSEEIAITYQLKYFRSGERYSTPKTETIACIKEALGEYGKWHLFNPEAYKRCQLTLIDGVTGKEI